MQNKKEPKQVVSEQSKVESFPKWKDCGYLGFTKNRKGIILIVKHQRYWLNLQEVLEVLQDKRRYTLVYEPIAPALDMR
jgi:hypothetical protein